MGPLVSIVIPVYNTEKYVGECLGSLIGQTYKELEIICVDDGSTDSSREIIHEYTEKDARISLITQEHSNAGAARNKGLKMAEGEFIAFLDSDDFFESDMVETMVKKAIFTQADCVFCRTVCYDNENDEYHDLRITRFQKIPIPDWDNFSKKDIPDYIFQLTGCAWDKLYKRSFIMENKLLFQEQQANNDNLFVYKSYILAKRMAICEDVAVRYRTNNAESIQGKWEKNWLCIFKVYDALKDWLRKENILELVETSFVNTTASRLISYMERLSEWDRYVEFYEHLKNVSIVNLGLFPREKEFYNNLELYKQLEYISNYDCQEYLLYHKNHLVSLNREYVFRFNKMKENMQSRMDKISIENERLNKMNKSKKWNFKETRLPEESRVVIYGYGDVGHNLAEQFFDSQRLSLQAIVDQNYEKFCSSLIPIRPVKEIYKIKFDYVIIAVWDKKMAEEIKSMLIGGGIDQEKIVWFEKEQ